MKRIPRLSICIATYNRSNFIAETLESIIPQLSDDIELLVVDGASTDNTEIILNEYALKEPRLRYVRFDKKGGVDQDYCKAVEMARGQYCWLFTDDDLIKPGAVNAVLNKMGNDVSLIVVNAEVLNRDLTKKIEDRIIKYDNDMVYENDQFEKLFADTINYMSFIGSVVINRAFWLQREKECYFGSEFIHLGVIFQGPLSAQACLIAEPYISIRYGNAQWNQRSFEIWMYKWPRLIWSLNGISREVKQSVVPEEPWRNLKTLLVRRGMGAYSLFEFRKYVLKERANLFWKLAAMLIVLLPFHILNKVFKLYFNSKKKVNKLFMYDLFLARHRYKS